MKAKVVYEIADRFIEDLLAELGERWLTWELRLAHKETHEVVGALLARQVTLARELARAATNWNYSIGPLVLRAMADLYINLAWILEDPHERSKKFIYFGLGQEKLRLEHLKDDLAKKGREPSPMERENLEHVEAWITMQRYPFLTEVNVGSWSEKSVREMAQEAGCLDFYNHVYQPWSGVAHSAWQHVGRYNVQQCRNPLHLYHLAPSVPRHSPDLSVLHLAAKYADKTFRLFDRKAGVKVDAPSAFLALEQRLESAAKEEAVSTGSSPGEEAKPRQRRSKKARSGSQGKKRKDRAQPSRKGPPPT